MKKLLVLLYMLLYVIGALTNFLLFMYILSASLYVFGDAGDPGLIARVPKWLFLFCPLVLLGKKKIVKITKTKFLKF